MKRFALGWATLAVTGGLCCISTHAAAQPRAALTTSGGDAGDNGDKGSSSSIFTIGTLYGVTIPLYKPTFYRVTDGRLERVRSSTAEDYFNPAVYVFPSVAIWTYRYTHRTMLQTEDVLKRHYANPRSLTPNDFDYSTGGRTLAVILPAGLTTGTVGETNVSVGVGLSLGWTISGKAEIGFSGAVVWNQTQYLDDEQKDYVNEELPAGVSDQIATRFRPSLALGLYITPTF